MVLVQVAIVALALALALVLVWVAHRRTQRKRLKTTPIVRIPTIGSISAPRKPHVVLVHGFAGFAEIRAFGVRREYFRGVRDRLEQNGIACTTARLPAVAPIADRAAALQALLASLAEFDVHVIAHSMGGLDARRALCALGGGPVRSLVTIATPHRGTPLAELGHALPARLSRRAIRDLSRASIDARGGELADVPGVRYGSVIASPARGALGVHPLLRASYLLLRAVAGENDGVVPVSSQAWGDVLATIDADHWGAIGWSGSFDAPGFYERLLGELGLELPQIAQFAGTTDFTSPSTTSTRRSG